MDSTMTNSKYKRDIDRIRKIPVVMELITEMTQSYYQSYSQGQVDEELGNRIKSLVDMVQTNVTEVM